MYKRSTTDIKFIAIHHSAGSENGTVEDIRHLHVDINGWPEVGYHYLITKNGIEPGRDINFTGAHAAAEEEGADAWMVNYYGVGICIVGNYEENPIPADRVKLAVDLIIELAGKYNIPIDEYYVFPHSDVDNTACPGRHTMPAIWKEIKRRQGGGQVEPDAGAGQDKVMIKIFGNPDKLTATWQGKIRPAYIDCTLTIIP